VKRESDHKHHHHHHHGMVIIYHTCMHLQTCYLSKKEEEWMEIGDETEKKMKER